MNTTTIENIRLEGIGKTFSRKRALQLQKEAQQQGYNFKVERIGLYHVIIDQGW